MNKNNKWNRELLYSTIFFAVAIIWFFWNPFVGTQKLISLSSVEMKQKLFDLGVYQLFYHVARIATIGSLFFLLCSIYFSLRSLSKNHLDSKPVVLAFIPKNFPGWLAVIQILICILFIINLIRYAVF
ncbi:MAG: hypothetical protein RL641_330 [Candidatus Parcubacteria bacterium]|jgi:hypothetical protein